MKRSPTALSALRGVAFLLLAATSGCGSSGGPTGDPAASVASCNAYCNAYIAAMCTPPIYVTLADCTQAECMPLTQAPGICQTKIKTYYDCQKTQADICGDMGCTDKFNSVLTCM